jgi:hypothetical protein
MAGQSVTRIAFDRSVTILTSSGSQLAISCSAVVSPDLGQSVSFDPEAPASAAALLVRLLGEVITSVDAGQNGELDILFATGCRITVQSDALYEAWEVLDVAGTRVVCMPGGELAIWTSRS